MKYGRPLRVSAAGMQQAAPADEPPAGLIGGPAAQLLATAETRGGRSGREARSEVRQYAFQPNNLSRIVLRGRSKTF